MRNLTDLIENYIISELMDEGLTYRLNRNELAEHFDCAPSQISYAVTSRFTPDKGFEVLSRRGKNGCIVIARLRQGENPDAELSAEEILEHMLQAGVVTPREASLISLSLEIADGHVDESAKRAIIKEALKRIRNS